MPTRRDFLILTGSSLMAYASEGAIDRKALVSRHNPYQTQLDARSPLSVGNGEFAFTVDITGLQSVPPPYESALPLCTQSQWGWHGAPLPESLAGAELRLESFDTYGRPSRISVTGGGAHVIAPGCFRSSPRILASIKARTL